MNAPVFRREKSVPTVPDGHDLITCRQCRQLRAAICYAGPKLTGSRHYSPDPELFRRCDGFVPKLSDPDQRKARERWRGLVHPGQAAGPLT